jgi:cell division protein FtsI (penicillin-binding protein 3)
MSRHSILCVLVLSSCAHAAPDPGAAAATPIEPTGAAIDRRARAAIDLELAGALDEPTTRAMSIVVLDPSDGRIIAMGGRRGATIDADLPARDPVGHGSVAKTFTIAIALERGAITTDDTFDGGGRAQIGAVVVEDASPHGVMRLEDVLAFSSNVGTARVLERVGTDAWLDGIARLRLDHRAPARARGDADAVVGAAIGAALAPTPLEIAAAFAAVVNGGVIHAPWRDGTDAPSPGERVLSESTSATMRALLEAAVSRDDGTGRRARVDGHRAGGKTGTMRLADGASYAAFAGAAPIDAPRFVIVVGVETRAEGYSGGTIAAPAFARIAAALLD